AAVMAVIGGAGTDLREPGARPRRCVGGCGPGQPHCCCCCCCCCCCWHAIAAACWCPLGKATRSASSGCECGESG
ncbi:MAG: hypothetical protein ACK4ZJ_03890, partial [Allorhizobium sp.]